MRSGRDSYIGSGLLSSQMATGDLRVTERRVRIRFNGELLRALIEAAGGIAAVQEKWSLSSPHGDDGEAPAEATFYRWMRGQLPKSSDTLMRLATVLDVDPFALLDVPKEEMSKATDELLELGLRESLPAPLSFASGFFGRQREWPPPAFAAHYFCREWGIREFVHDPAVRASFYQTIELRGQGCGVEKRAQVFHFAYRQKHLFAARWLQYGFVVRWDCSALLWHINGHREERRLRSQDEPAVVETWFGPAAVDFRVASLHPFALAVPAVVRPAEPPMHFPI
jgi:hypothetical protein